MENYTTIKHLPYNIGIGDLLLTYSDVSKRKFSRTLIYPKSNLWSVQKALDHMKFSLANITNWISLNFFMPKLTNTRKNKIYKNSIISSLFTASLELARKGEISIRQEKPFGEIFLKNK